MSVTAVGIIERREWGGLEDPRMPIGTWFSAGGVAGDASGGVATVTMQFQLFSAQAVSGDQFSLEQMTINNSGGVAENASVQMLNMGDGEQGWAVRLVVTLTPLLIAALPADIAALKGIFLGGQAAQGADASLRTTVTNTLNAALFVTAEGYIWGSRARSVLGGPRKPAGALWP